MGVGEGTGLIYERRIMELDLIQMGYGAAIAMGTVGVVTLVVVLVKLFKKS